MNNEHCFLLSVFSVRYLISYSNMFIDTDTVVSINTRNRIKRSRMKLSSSAFS